MPLCQLATGVQWRKLDVPGMDRLQDAGVYYGAASTEALSCSGEDVYRCRRSQLGKHN